MSIGIYCIENLINGHKYIGASKHIEQRWKEHIRDAKNFTQPNKSLYQAFLKYGTENFSFYILQECQEDELWELEKYYIKQYDTFCNGYNETMGGQYPTNCYHPSGDKHPNSLITENIAKNIIKDLANSRDSFKTIADKYNCSIDIIKDINTLKTHKYLHNYSSNIRDSNKVKRNSSFEKLTAQQVHEIINLLIFTDQTYTEIGKKYNVSHQTISRINKCQTWTELHSYSKNIREESKNGVCISS